jgi:asparagine synthase (glutamine-hydrolysing)
MFAFAILDGHQMYLARDPIGIKPLYYAIDSGQLYFSSEIKAMHWLLERVKEFPPGHWWHSAHGLQRYYQLDRPQLMQTPAPARPTREHIRELRETIRAAVTKRLIADKEVGVGVSLSGGLDSSIIAALAREGRERLDTFAVGVPDSEDLHASQRVAQYLGTTHHPHVYSFDDMLKALPEVIYHLESFDTALVRSAIPNYFLAQLASRHVKVMLTGEGADELFAGYKYLEAKDDPDDLHAELKTITGNLHNTNLQRTDRMTMAHGLEARVPFLDVDVISLAFRLPAEWKMPGSGRAEKALLRQTFADCLPDEIVQRPKQKFSDGAGSIELMAHYASDTISDAEFVAERGLPNGAQLQSKEHLLYYRIFREHFGDSMSYDVIGRTRSVVPGEIA